MIHKSKEEQYFLKAEKVYLDRRIYAKSERKNISLKNQCRKKIKKMEDIYLKRLSNSGMRRREGRKYEEMMRSKIRMELTKEEIKIVSWKKSEKRRKSLDCKKKIERIKRRKKERKKERKSKQTIKKGKYGDKEGKVKIVISK